MAGKEQLTLPRRSDLITSVTRGESSEPRSKRAAGSPFSEEVEAAWHNFPNRPGKHLSMMRTGHDSWNLVADSSGAVSTTCAHTTSIRVPHMVASQGRTYVWRRASRKKLLPSHQVVDLVDVTTNSPVLRMSGLHLDHRAATRLTLVGQRELRFPVTGPEWRALMSAIDETGNSLIEYRLVPSARRSLLDCNASTEAVISPTAMAIPHIELLAAVSSPFLLGYFQTGVG